MLCSLQKFKHSDMGHEAFLEESQFLSTTGNRRSDGQAGRYVSIAYYIDTTNSSFGYV
jgi:hypothetical protein